MHLLVSLSIAKAKDHYFSTFIALGAIFEILGTFSAKKDILGTQYPQKVSKRDLSHYWGLCWSPCIKNIELSKHLINRASIRNEITLKESSLILQLFACLKRSKIVPFHFSLESLTRKDKTIYSVGRSLCWASALVLNYCNYCEKIFHHNTHLN